MDVSDISVKSPSTASVVKTSEAPGVPAAGHAGNALPVTGHTHGRVEDALAKHLASQPDAAKLNGLVDQANKALAQRTSTLKFSVAKDTNIRVIEVVDTETGKVIRQIPSEQMVAIAQSLKEIKQGSMLEDKA